MSERLKGTVAIIARDENTAELSVAAAMQLDDHVDILVNNAGVAGYRALADTTADEYDETMDQNMRSTSLFTRHVVPQMLAQRIGAIFMIASMAGVAALTMLEATTVAGAVVLACTQSPGARIIEIQMRTMSKSLA